jgi:hypothetical protein
VLRLQFIARSPRLFPSQFSEGSIASAIDEELRVIQILTMANEKEPY